MFIAEVGIGGGSSGRPMNIDPMRRGSKPTLSRVFPSSSSLILKINQKNGGQCLNFQF